MRFLLDTSLIFIFIRYSSKDVLFIGEYIIIKLHILKYDGIIIVRGGQSSWIFMVILAHKFISSRTHVPTNHEKCGYPPTLTPANKNDSTVSDFCTIRPDYSSNTKNRFNALKFWSVFISKILLKVNFKYKMNLLSVLCLKH